MRKYLIIIIIGILLSLCYAIVSSEKDTECLNRQKITAVDGESMEQTEHSNERVRPLKGRPFQELVDLCEELNDILFCTMLKSEQRAEALLAKGAPMEYTALIEMAKLVNLSEKQQCDAPCFAAIQDSIIRSATDETLDVYWYYKVQGQDSVLMFNMAEYKKDYPELYFLENLTTDANMLNWKAMTTAFAASARQSSQLDDSIYKATFEQIYAMGFIVGLNDGDCTAQQFFKHAKQTAGMTPQEILTENYQNDLPEMDSFGLIKQIHDPQEFYDLITGDQKDFGFYFMLKGYEAAIRVLGCDDLIRKKYNNNQQRIVQKCRELYSAAYSSSCKE
ncbi:hypothetical protein [uncultured Parabacteroides sp.]|uniref:hypothetical protein n=1 Tax=uncultured Parabacteroides sp. TaxID=512312 RepID=UPI0026EBD6CF|nr:hypothetical protein [uncultured Parabacteroides sp.]